MTKEYTFLALCFFTLGIFCLISFITFFLTIYFKSKKFAYYLLYVISTAVFITVVLLTNGDLISKKTYTFKFLELIYDPIQILIFYLHNLFIYNTLLKENIKYNNFSWIIKSYTILIVILIFLAIEFPNFMNDHGYLYLVSRIIILTISFTIYFWLCRELANVYLRYIFIACNIMLLFGFIALWDSTVNSDNSFFKGFQYICIGYVLENLCFAAAFIYQIITVDKKKKADDINFERKLLSTQIEIQTQTMQHIGREIHDNIGQKLTLASLYTQQLAFENKAPHITVNIENISNIINSSLSELRKLSKSLTDNSIENKNLVSLLKSECHKINEYKTCTFTYSKETTQFECAYETKSFIVRIVQEFLQNSIKHSNCEKMEVNLSKEDFYLKLIMKDNGNGFDTNKINSGIGLLNMKKRTELIRGIFLLESDKNGTNLSIKIPI